MWLHVAGEYYISPMIQFRVHKGARMQMEGTREPPAPREIMTPADFS